MSSYQYVYHMDNLGKTYPGGKPVFTGISLHFLPDAKIGVVGMNGAGKSTLLRIMAGQDTEFTGEAWAEKGVRVGYLPQEPVLDDDKTVWDNVIEGYYNQPEKLQSAIVSLDGTEWFRTGDLAMVDDEGFFFIKGRQKDMIIVGL